MAVGSSEDGEWWVSGIFEELHVGTEARKACLGGVSTDRNGGLEASGVVWPSLVGGLVI